jgi:hypothetical protein
MAKHHRRLRKDWASALEIASEEEQPNTAGTLAEISSDLPK